MFEINVQSRDGEDENRRPYKDVRVLYKGVEVYHCELSPACRNFQVRQKKEYFLLEYDYKGEWGAYRFVV